ncbi:MAG: DUF3798 domain-containing protein [Eubacteriaceae bacterium]|nr:DUF3798 domain-containing protein [Eubacteriaceae bacterium]
MKKLIAMLLAAMMIFSFAACGDKDGGDDTTTTAGKVVVITSTTSQGEEEYQAGLAMQAKYPDRVKSITWPAGSSTTEQMISTVTQEAADKDVKAIVMCQAAEGTIAAINACKEMGRDDILFVGGVCHEPPAAIGAVCDVCMLVDEIGMGTEVIKQAKSMGAETFVHISFARHLSLETIAKRRVLFQETCAELGIEYVEATAPDPAGDAGVPGAQQWIVENIPTYVQEYGVNTAFFSTNCGMQEPLIRTVAEQKAIYPQQCCPSPYHGYPSALAIEVAGHEGDVEWMLEAIKGKVAEYGNSGRMSTWTVPINMLFVEAGVEYALDYIDGKVSPAEGTKLDDAAFRAIVNEIAGGSAIITNYEDDNEGTVKNFYTILCPFYTF